MTHGLFLELVQPLTAFVAGRPIDATLVAALDRRFPAEGSDFGAIERACREAIAAGWMCSQGGAGRRFGRVVEAGEETHGLSVDVVELTDAVGPHHVHPLGEVCMVMPQSPEATFLGTGRGWCVFPPGSDHHPAVAGGTALVMYLLPEGRIEFTGTPAGT